MTPGVELPGLGEQGDEPSPRYDPARMTEQETIESVRSSLRSGRGVHGMLEGLFRLNELRSEACVASLFPEVVRLLGPNHIGRRARDVLLILPTDRLEPLAAAWTEDFLNDFENELNEYWGLFDMLQAAGLSQLSRRVALRAAEAPDEDLRRSGRDWLLELEDGIERR